MLSCPDQPDDLRELRAAATAHGMSLRHYLLDAVHTQAAYLRLQAALRRTAARLAGRPPVSDEARDAVLDAFEVMSALRAAANRPEHPFEAGDLPHDLQDAESYEIDIEGTPWTDVRRAWVLSERSLRYADAVYVAAAERHQTALLTADRQIERSGVGARCQIVTVVPVDDTPPATPQVGTEGSDLL